MTSSRLSFPPAGLLTGARLRLLVCGSLALSCAGCGRPGASVEGTVTLDGSPLPAARVSFHPDSPGPVAYGLSLDDGSYRLKTGAKQSGLAPGGYRVTVFALEAVAGAEEKVGPLLTPPVYGDPATTPLQCQVDAGLNRVPLALESTAKAAKP